MIDYTYDFLQIQKNILRSPAQEVRCCVGAKREGANAGRVCLILNLQLHSSLPSHTRGIEQSLYTVF